MQAGQLRWLVTSRGVHLVRVQRKGLSPSIWWVTLGAPGAFIHPRRASSLCADLSRAQLHAALLALAE